MNFSELKFAVLANGTVKFCMNTKAIWSSTLLFESPCWPLTVTLVALGLLLESLPQ